MDVSFLIPARNEIYLEKTIRNILENIRGDSEILVALDGYLPEPQIVTNDPRVTFYHEPVAIGQRQSINKLARLAKGKYICKLDAHCAIDVGFDVKMMADCEYDWTVIPRMYNLDRHTFMPKMHKRTDYMYIGWNEKNQLRSLYYSGDEWRKWHRREELIDDTMGCMGPCFFMHKDRFWELGGCDEEHGSWGSQGIEVALKAWLSGGSLKVNKKTWFAHWFRGGDGGFPYPIKQSEIDKARKHAEDLWLNNKWGKQTRNLEWVINKFKPKGWDNFFKENMEYNQKELHKLFYNHIHIQRQHPTWKGITILKMPSDIQLYHEVIWENKPDLIIEIGTKFGGLSLYLQDQLDLIGNGGKVATVDVSDQVKEKDPRITYILRNSIHEDTRKELFEMAKDKKVMMILDGNHNRNQVKWELHYYKDIVTSGQYMVVEDCYSKTGELYGPGEAKDWFLKRTKKYIQTDIDKKYLVGFNISGWLRKV
jgi:cephalosporin hydroxylase